MTDTLAPARSGKRIGDVGSPVATPRAKGVEQPLNVRMHVAIRKALLPLREQLRRFWILERDAAHDREAVGIALSRLKSIVVTVSGPGWWHDDCTVDAGLVHQRHCPLDGKGLRQLRLHARHPFPVVAFRLPQMDLRVDNGALARALGGGRLSRGLLRA